MRKTCLLVLVMCLCAFCAAQAKGKKKTEMKRVYMYGFAASFVDSTAYITDVQMMDSAYISPEGFLQDRSLYAIQMNSYLESAQNKRDMTCVVLFGEKRNKVIKEYMKVRKRYAEDGSVKLVMLNRQEFAFHPEEYMEQEITVVDADEPKGK